MTYNVDYANPEPASAIEAIAEADVDVVLLQEITAKWQHALTRRLSSNYPWSGFRLGHRPAGGMAVLSKLPIVEEEVLRTPHRGWFDAERILLAAPFGTLQILHVHLRPAFDSGGWITGFLSTPPLRREEIELYWRALAPGLPTIVAGDFNEDPCGLAIAFLDQQGLRRVETHGPRTWHYEVPVDGVPWDLLQMDIDHVMIDRALVAHEGRVIDAGRSDHRPVIADVELVG
jgi:endonuclease/exonuclease/phosphatase family metal-dependent hydrolase